MLRISCILLAAGKSSRMEGRNKLTMEVDNVPLVTRTFLEISKVLFEEVIVVTGFEEDKIRSHLIPYHAKFIHNSHYSSGMHSSIKTGLNAFTNNCDAFFICLADQPYFNESVLELLIKKATDHPGNIYVPVYHGKRGNPVLISSRFVPEIMNEPDGDYGCSYLLKRHMDAVIPVEVESDGILLDMDTPEDYDRVRSPSHIDPVKNLFAKIVELRNLRETFATATVIEVIGSSSARTGSKAIFNQEGHNIAGWVGGGCAERFIGEECSSAIKAGQPRIVLADLDDEIFGLGVACGGKMKVFIEPFSPMESIPVSYATQYRNEVVKLAGHYGWEIANAGNKTSQTPGELILALIQAVSLKRGTAMKSLREIRPVPATFLPVTISRTKNVIIVGRTRITEALARHFSLLMFNVTAIGPDVNGKDYPEDVKCHCLNDSYESIVINEKDIVIIASHTAQDPMLVKKALDAGASYVGMIGSLKRSEEVLTYLNLLNHEISSPLFIPAGLDIDAKNPDEIALSVAGEILTLMEAE